METTLYSQESPFQKKKSNKHPPAESNKQKTYPVYYISMLWPNNEANGNLYAFVEASAYDLSLDQQ